MSKPTIRDQEKLRRLARYLQAKPRATTSYYWQDTTDEVSVFTDSDWANDARSRRSHSGGVIMRGGHLLSHWTRIQSVIALSSGEAELYSCVLGVTRALGVLHLGRSIWGEHWGHLAHFVDSAACKSIVFRKGSGAVKHLSTKDLWVQEAIRRYAIEVRKVARDENPADTLASYSSPPTMTDHLTRMNCSVFAMLGSVRVGRARGRAAQRLQ